MIHYPGPPFPRSSTTSAPHLVERLRPEFSLALVGHSKGFMAEPILARLSATCSHPASPTRRSGRTSCTPRTPTRSPRRVEVVAAPRRVLRRPGLGARRRERVGHRRRPPPLGRERRPDGRLQTRRLRSVGLGSRAAVGGLPRDLWGPPEQCSGLQQCPLRSRSEAPWSVLRGSSSSHGFAAASGEHSRFPTSKVRPSRPRTPAPPRKVPSPCTPFEADLCVLLWRRGHRKKQRGEGRGG